MKLKTELKIKVYEVLADYKLKVPDSPFIAILKFTEENKGRITSRQLYDFLQPLSIKACENLLDRLKNMGYFIVLDAVYNGDADIYSLTELGRKSAEKEEFYDNRHGILRIFLTNNEFIRQRIVKIEEVRKQDSFDETHLETIRSSELSDMKLGQTLSLETGSYILESFGEKCRMLNNEIKKLVLEANQKNCTVKLMQYHEVRSDLDSNIIKDIALSYMYQENYITEKQIVEEEFDSEFLELKNDIVTGKIRISNTEFDSIILENVKSSPKNIGDAKKWHKALAIQNIDQYFFTKKELVDFTNEVALDFELYKTKLKNNLSKEELIKGLSKKEDFYKKAKLETTDYLNY